MSQAYFENIEFQIIKIIESANQSIKIAVAWFTNENIFNSLLKKLDSKIKIEIIINDDDLNNNDTSLDFNRFIEKGGYFYFINSKYFLHHKFVIIDNYKIITGSYNFTEIAESINIENIIICENQNIVKRYLGEFSSLITYSNQQDKFEKRNIKNVFSINYIQPDRSEKLTLDNKYNEFVVVDLDFDYLTIENIENKEIFRVNIWELEKVYNINDRLKIKLPFELLKGIKTKNNYVLGPLKTNIIHLPTILE